MTYQRLLRVANLKGERISAIVNKNGPNVNIRVPFLNVVLKDNPPFANKGIIRMVCKQKDYSEVIEKVTKYLEDLFLKELESENTNTSIGTNNDTGGNEREYPERKIGFDTGEGCITSVHDS